MALDVKVKINLTKPIGRAGFGFPLFVAEAVTNDDTKMVVPAIDYTVCSSLDDLISKGVGTDTDLYKSVALLLSQNNAPEKFAICVIGKDADFDTVVEGISNYEWRQLILVGFANSVEAISEYIETTEFKMFFTSVTDEGNATNLKTRDRTVVMFYDKDTQGARPEAALVGATAGLDVGSFTYKNIILKGLDPIEKSDTEIDDLSQNNVITVVEKAGDIVTTEGKSMNGEYIDVIDSKDYVVQQIAYRTQKLLNQSAKIPYTNSGIAMLESVTVDVLKDCYNKDMIATNEDGSPAYSVAFALREDSDKTDIANRRYIGGKFAFKIAGAIHEAEITGEITL